MFQQWDYGVKLTKEQEIRERILRAQVERLVHSTRPGRERLSTRRPHGFMYIAGHLPLGLFDRWITLAAKHMAGKAPHTRRAWTSRPQGG